ncbi:MAG: ABC transporter ATP-binding protein [Chloroflexi bacterium]|nr:ABC transporter ATP-binding protein [Chloroflexota bacterium]
MTAMLDIQGIESGYSQVQILWGVSIKLEQGKLVTLVGANGSGKTTLLRTVCGLLNSWKGTITFQGRDITKLSPHEKAQMGIVMEMGATPNTARAEYSRNVDWVFELLPRLKERMTQKAGTLSGGEQQMLAIARGLMSQPQILLFDEMSLGLSPLLMMNLFQVVRTLKNRGYTMLLVEQNVQMALAVSDYAYVMEDGRIAAEGEAKQVAKLESVRKAYLGI